LTSDNHLAFAAALALQDISLADRTVGWGGGKAVDGDFAVLDEHL